MPVSSDAFSLFILGPAPEPGTAIEDEPARAVPSTGLPDFPGGLPAAVMHLTSLITATGLASLATVTVPDGPPRAPRPSHAPTSVLGGRMFLIGEGGHSRQLRHRDGPGLAACSTGRPVAVEDVTTDRRWPAWSADADAAGYSSTLSMPLPARFITGALDLWSSRPRRFDADDMRQAADLAAVTAALLDAALRQQHLDRALAGRTVIGQAQGILIERHRLTPTAAFAALSLLSQELNRKVRDVSDELVATGQPPSRPRDAPRAPQLVPPPASAPRRHDTPPTTRTLHEDPR